MSDGLGPQYTDAQVWDRGCKIAQDLRADGVPVMGVDAPDQTDMVGLVFLRKNGRLLGVRTHYEDAEYRLFRSLAELADGTPSYARKAG